MVSVANADLRSLRQTVLASQTWCYSGAMTEGIRGDRVKLLRERQGWSQSELARQMTQAGSRTIPSHISALERGDRGLGTKKLTTLAQVLETNPNYLLGLSDDDSPPSDQEEQVVVAIRDERSRELIQEAINLLAARPYKDQLFLIEVFRRLVRPAPLPLTSEQGDARQIAAFLRSQMPDEVYQRLMRYVGEASRTGDLARLFDAVSREAAAVSGGASHKPRRQGDAHQLELGRG